MKWIALSTTESHDYSFLTPITALAWKHVAKYEPYTLFVGEGIEGSYRVAYNFYCEMGMQEDVIYPMPPFRDHSVAQSIRHHFAAYHLPEDDLIMPGDADLIPLTYSFYQKHDPNQHAIGLYYHNGTGEKNHFPTCHMSMTVRTWREILGISKEDTIESSLRRSLEKIPHDADGMTIWYHDQVFSSKKIVESKYFPNSVDFISREGMPPKDRIDRSNWPSNLSIEGKTDCHSLRPGWTDENWPRLRPVIAQILPQFMDKIDAYREAFKKAKVGS